MNNDTMPARAHRGDVALALTVFILLAFGLIMMYNINPALNQKLGGQAAPVNYFRNQLVNVVVGLVAWGFASSVYFKLWRKYAVSLLVLAVICLVALLVP